MDGSATLEFAAIIGFTHAFEADHLLAVSTLVSKSKSIRQMVVNGFLWGLGHTSTIFIIGLLLILFNIQALKAYFDYFEIFVGVMLILLGVHRLWQYQKQSEAESAETQKREAYGIGLVHGLAGSGTLVLFVMTDLEGSMEAILYLVLFGLGSAVGMSVAASVLRIPILKGKGNRHP